MGGTNGSGLKAILILPRQQTLLAATCWRSFLQIVASEPFTPRARTSTTVCRRFWQTERFAHTYYRCLQYHSEGIHHGPGELEHRHLGLKWFDISESIKLRFTADFFNAFNHPVDVGFGHRFDTTTGLQDLSRQVNEPRIIQLSVRLNWYFPWLSFLLTLPWRWQAPGFFLV